MKILAAVFQGMPFLMAILVGMLVPILVVISGLLAEKWKDSSKVATILGILILGNAVSVLLSGRVLYSQEEMALNPLLALDLEQGRGVWAGRITNATILFVSLGEIFRWVTKRRKMPETAVPLLLAFLAFYIASYWVGVFFATAREIQLSWLYAPIAFTALALISKDGLNKEALTKLEWVLVLILGASLAGAILVPGMTLEPGYKSWVPGFSSRLYGFAEHANSLGIIAALAVILELSPFVRKVPNLIFLLIAIVALVFAQSKTAWMAAFVGIFLVRFEDIRTHFRTKSPGQFALMLFAFASVAMATALIALILAFHYGLIDRLLRFDQAFTFTGRTRIWEISWNEFLKNPLFGYGPALWDLQYRYQNNFMAAGQAHNQFFQTAGQAGLLGIVSLAIYVYMIGRRCAINWRLTSGLAGVAFVSLRNRCF
jgi:O-antigen ligase